MSHHHYSHPYMKRREYSNFSHRPEQMSQVPDDGMIEEETPLKEMTGQQTDDVTSELPKEAGDNDIDQQKSSIAEELEKQLRDERLRMAAEMDNFKKRLNREHQEQVRYAAERVLSDLLPALDNLDMAIQYGGNHEACADMMKGIEMTRAQLLDAVAKSGLTVFGEKGEEFNPALHEAIGIASDPELDKDVISKVMQRGYKLNDRVLRPAKVMVNK